MDLTKLADVRSEPQYRRWTLVANNVLSSIVINVLNATDTNARHEQSQKLCAG